MSTLATINSARVFGRYGNRSLPTAAIKGWYRILRVRRRLEKSSGFRMAGFGNAMSNMCYDMRFLHSFGPELGAVLSAVRAGAWRGGGGRCDAGVEPDEGAGSGDGVGVRIA